MRKRKGRREYPGDLFDPAARTDRTSESGAAQGEGRKVYSVSELTGEVKALLEAAHPQVYVRGEISNFYRHSSGHIYMTLKDEHAQLMAVFFKGSNLRLKFEPENGMDVIACGRLTVYEPRGEYQINVEFLEPAGVGALQMRIEQLKKKLAAEGLFDEKRKREIPEFPAEIAVVTSPQGAAIRDFLKVTRTRFPAQHIVIFPALVQGEEAPAEIVQAVRDANETGGFDVLVVTRGGGSLEDLMAFNDEGVARAIVGSDIPVISAIGHERDFTIADMVADFRAATPSQAAEKVTPSRVEILAWLDDARERLERRARSLVEDLSQELDDISSALAAGASGRLKELGGELREMAGRLRSLSPGHVLVRRREVLEQLLGRVSAAAARRVAEAGDRLKALGATLNALSPLAVLERGYAIAFSLPGREVIKEASQVKPGDDIEVRLAKGNVRAKADKIDSGSKGEA